jgi:hypothetical protein
MTRDWGRHVFGAAAILFGASTLYWREVARWPQIQSLGDGMFLQILVYLAAAALIAGGIAIQWRATARPGAIALSAAYLFLAVLWIPRIFPAPGVYDRWGNFFEQFSLFSGALLAYANLAPDVPLGGSAARIGRVLFGICVASFALEQVFYLHATASLVPAWVPLGPTFWAVATTVAFALAAIAIVSGRQALLASRLLTAMLLLFGLLIWLPAVLSNYRSHFNWSESIENLAIAAVAWILADYSSRTDRATIHRQR